MRKIKSKPTNHTPANSDVYVHSRFYTSNTSEAYELYDFEPAQKTQKTSRQAQRLLVQSSERMPLAVSKIIFLLAVAVLASVSYITIQASNTARQRTITAMTQNIEKLNTNNAYLEAQLNATIDLKRIENEAQLRLGMSKPKSYQIKYIDVQTESYVEQNNSQQSTSQANKPFSLKEVIDEFLRNDTNE
jgi:cell division protein FtsB